MRIRRNKNYRRIMQFYRINFDIQETFHVLVDGTFVNHALQHKIHVKEQLPKILGGRATPMVTGCITAELRKLGPRALGAAIIAKGYYKVKCNHDKAVSAADCIKEQVQFSGNQRRFIVASQDLELVKELRKIPGVPVLRLHGPVPQLEEPSTESRAAAEAGQDRISRPSDWEKPKLPQLQAKEAAVAADAAKPKKKKGPKGPNPLSCRKPKKRQEQQQPELLGFEANQPVRAKRVRSRRMGTRTKAEVEALKTNAAVNTEASSHASVDAVDVDSEADTAGPGIEVVRKNGSEGNERPRCRAKRRRIA